MGSSQSDSFDSPLNPLLLKFVGQEHISADDSFWSEFLLFSRKPCVSLEEDKNLFMNTSSLFNDLYINNTKTGNFGSLLRVFLGKASELLVSTNFKDNSCINLVRSALVVIKCYLQHLVHKHPEDEVIQQIEAQGTLSSIKPEVAEPMIVQLLDSLIDLVIHVPVRDSTYALLLETINTLLVLLSVQLFTSKSTSELQIYEIICESKQTEAFCKALLKIFVQQPLLPHSSGGSLLLDLAAELIGLFISPPENDGSFLGRNAILLCIVLVNHSVGPVNGFQNCLSSISDELGDLFRTICLTLHKEETTLVLYHLLIRNSHFKTYVLSCPDIESLVLPVLQTIYNASDSSSYVIYMSLIILLILTEDTNFNKKVHYIVVKNATWYTDRNLPEITLGGLIILVTTRTVQYNLLKMRDEYLHTNCLAALVNMSSQFVHLHTYVCQRLVGLFEVLAKTYKRSKQELLTIKRALINILEVLNYCLSHQLVYNTNLIYTLLYKKSVFISFRNDPDFQDIISNLDQVLEYFSSKLEQEADSCSDVSALISVIVKVSPQWPAHRMLKFPDLKFKYVEEEKPEMFFIPYVWTLVTQHSNIYWDSTEIKSFYQY